ncbi:TonB-dependent receptor domain-containing protein [Endozoicomonas sp. 8E]|uniref:TonB-dependent receptor domain-containing protein n=1 Tax=Endozoicomonas sp. 8E TaxID=3035692 RepID=UPI002938FB0A|nr:TonB-dependent receptor [Endozoicomonas sp. 8E]WOG26697.1 TonB-dependent receptor [Endozoicomonas sp. 8E]
MSRTLRIAVALATAGLAGTLQASEEIIELEEVVVTASRTAQSVDEALAPVTVITREEIERSQATSVPELLSKTPGMQIEQSGGPGSKVGIFLRGTRTAQTLILIDGVKASSMDFGEAPIQHLDPDQIQRIEIVRGPKSSLYGANAVGGVIQIFTRKGTGNPKLTVKVGGGSRGTGDYGLNYGGEVDGTRFNLGARLFETQGYNRTFATSGLDADDDAYRDKSLSGSISKRYSSGLEAGLSFTHVEGKSEYDSSFNTENTYTLFNSTEFNGFVFVPVTEQWGTRLDIGYGIDKRDDKGSTTYPSYATTKRNTFSWQNDLNWTENQFLVTGIDYSDEHLTESSNEYGVEDQYNIGVFAQNTSTFSRSELQIGLRRDKHEVYGYNNTGNIAWGIDLPKGMKIIASYGTAYRAPTLGDYYTPAGPNLTLKPETAKNKELELSGLVGDSRWSVNIFQNDINDMLEYNSDAQKTENIEKARIRGIEFVLSTELFGWHTRSNMTFLDPEFRGDLYNGNVLYRRAKQLFVLDTNRVYGKWSVGGTFRAQGKTYNDQANTKEVAGFGTVDLRMAYQLTTELKTEAKVVNLMDKEYSSNLGYRDEPRGVFFTLTWTPEL